MPVTTRVPPPEWESSSSGGSLSLSEFVDRAVRDSAESSARFDQTSEFESMRGGGIELEYEQDRISRMFQTSLGRDLYAVVGNETLSVGLLGIYAAELATELIKMSEPWLSTASGNGGREIAVFGPQNATNVLLLSPDLPTGSAPIVSDPATALDLLERLPGAWNQLKGRLDDEMDSEYMQLFLHHGSAGALEAISAIRPRIVSGGAPRMELLSAPWPPFDVVYKDETSTAGVIARDKYGQAVVTVAYHATGGAGEKITIQGLETTVVKGSSIFDTSYADLPVGIKVSDLRGRAGPMIKRPPARGEKMEFFGAKSQRVSTVVEGVDMGIPRVDRGRMRCVQTKRDTNPGDSGAALINSDDEVVGFCYSRTEHDEPLEFADWVWAKSVYDVLELQPV